MQIHYDAALLEKYPAARGGMIIVRGLTNGPTPPGLAEAYQAEQAATLLRVGDTPFGDIPSLAAWRSAFRGFGAEPTKHRSAAEALLRRLRKKGDIPNLNLLVDLGNLVSIRYGMPVAMMDCRDVTGDITVRLANGDERFTELGSSAVKHPEAGEVIFSDDTGLVFARRWCWRQSAQSASRPDTTDIFITLEGHHTDAEAEVQAGLNDLQALLAEYAGGEVLAAGILKEGNTTVG